MLRLMNVLAVLVLIGSAVYAYSIKYATLYQVEKMAKLKRELQAETDALAMVRAEWAHVAAPVRIEALADQYLGGGVMQLSQIATLASLPDKSAPTDEIGDKLEALGLAGPTSTPGAAKPTATPSATPAPKSSIRTGR
ncbi:MAG TPA: hypothetical protein VMU18_08425 [Rhodoblastus sp.]|nr:hypothetical protein [Rhodoblastus sp.]